MCPRAVYCGVCLSWRGLGGVRMQQAGGSCLLSALLCKLSHPSSRMAVEQLRTLHSRLSCATCCAGQYAINGASLLARQGFGSAPQTFKTWARKLVLPEQRAGMQSPTTRPIPGCPSRLRPPPPSHACRNSRRLELLYVSGSHALAPEVHELAEAAQAQAPGQLDGPQVDAARLAAMKELDPEASTTYFYPTLVRSLSGFPALLPSRRLVSLPPCVVFSLASRWPGKVAIGARGSAAGLGCLCSGRREREGSPRCAGCMLIVEVVGAQQPGAWALTCCPHHTFRHSIAHPAALLPHQNMPHKNMSSCLYITPRPKIAATQASEGMSGSIAPPAGEPCPAVVPAPFESLGEDITSNSVVCCVYKLPQHKPHATQLLPGAVEEVGGERGGSQEFFSVLLGRQAGMCGLVRHYLVGMGLLRGLGRVPNLVWCQAAILRWASNPATCNLL